MAINILVIIYYRNQLSSVSASLDCYETTSVAFACKELHWTRKVLAASDSVIAPICF